ncbi:MAG: class I SAM-dependent methyltransferase [Planctomycetes bacterium]|nr:class I SAM-dependent methyltransferase [Planctomycetota bacterium]MCP4770693.1 class I SAM-dependent methyltransferase [Planctomycetota bacterium]MCP4860576.1 class I SAM-dependent methyltransferase [Planctomycetota bacterium]
MSLTIQAAERSLLPDPMIRWGIRRLLGKRLRGLYGQTQESNSAGLSQWLQQMRSGPIAIDTGEANEQHYEVPADFYALCLGDHRKYSSCYWDSETTDLSQAEESMLRLTCQRAQLEDGQSILELGCGWGSLSLWMAKQYPNSKVLSVSNSASQRTHILEQAKQRGITNLCVETMDMNDFQPNGEFDRVVSVEMIEHMRNWEELLGRISSWLLPGGRLFLHFFSHREVSYPFEDSNQNDWMARNFFTGGMMPSHGLPSLLDIPFKVVADWPESGSHYQRTAEAWLQNLDKNREQAIRILQGAGYADKAEAERQVQRWRMFFLACAELFGFRQGNEWLVSHYLLEPSTQG